MNRQGQLVTAATEDRQTAARHWRVLAQLADQRAQARLETEVLGLVPIRLDLPGPNLTISCRSESLGNPTESHIRPRTVLSGPGALPAQFRRPGRHRLESPGWH